MKIHPHPHVAKLAARLQIFKRSLDVRFEGELFRFINPQYSKAVDIIDGTGAIHAAGRWNLVGAARLSYTALEPDTALSEALAHVRYFRLPLSKALPSVLVALRFKAKRVLDLRDGNVRRGLKLSAATITNLDWRAENRKGSEAVTQAWGGAFAGAGFEAVIVPSSADPGGSNVLVFPGNLQPGSHFEVVSEVRWPGK